MVVVTPFRIIGVMGAFLLMGTGWAQQRRLDHQGFAGEDRLATVTPNSIAPDGRYIAYTVAAFGKGIRLVVKEVEGTGYFDFHGAGQYAFTGNSRYLLVTLPGDTLCILELARAMLRKIAGVRNWKIPSMEKGASLALLSGEAVATWMDLERGREKTWRNVTDYWCNEKGNMLLLAVKGDTPEDNHRLLKITSALERVDTIYNGPQQPHSLAFDEQGGQLAFIAGQSLFYYSAASIQAKQWITPASPGMMPRWQLMVGSHYGFTEDGRRFLTGLLFPPPIQYDSRPEGLDIWHYRQNPPALNAFNNRVRNGVGVVRVGDSTLILLRQPGDAGLHLAAGGRGDHALAIPRTQSREQAWRNTERLQLVLVDITTGKRKSVASLYQRNNEENISPAGRYISWYDAEQRQYFVYNIQDSMVRCVTRGISTALGEEDNDHPAPPPPYGIAGWLPGDEALIVYDSYDIWKIDPQARKAPVCLTNGYGRKNKVVLRVMDAGQELGRNTALPPLQQPWILTAFYMATKETGFYRLVAGAAMPQLLSKGPFIDYAITLNGRMGKRPVKAKEVDRYIVTRMSATQSPNVYITSDFRSFKAISSIRPEAQYQWLKAGLFHCPLPGGRQASGILYTPQALDTARQYPLIFYCYERQSDLLQVFREPDMSNGPLNIPFYVSNGYIVVVPDIHYRIGQPGESALEAVQAAADYIARLPWADTTHMGLQGHSFGAYAVNYIITRSNRFRAACSSAGLSNLISGYNSLWQGESAQWVYEVGQTRMGSTLWQQPQHYEAASPVMAANNVQTPMLILHNRNDPNVPWNQGLEWFMALRRLGKPVWMLEYKGEGHQLQQPANRLDFSIRLQQFFDHYLKGLPAPGWMQ